MAKGQKRSNREIKKPKAVKAPKETPQSPAAISKARLGQISTGTKKR